MSMISRPLGLALLAGATLVCIDGVNAQDSRPTPERNTDSRQDKKIGDKAIRQASQLFQKTCVRCHVIPDPAVRTDRGWLDQVNRTA